MVIDRLRPPGEDRNTVAQAPFRDSRASSDRPTLGDMAGYRRTRKPAHGASRLCHDRGMAVMREDPYGQFNFVVEIAGIVDPSGPDGGFSEVSGLDVTIETVEYRNGSDRVNAPRKLNGLVRYGDVTLKRGLMGSLRLWQWLEESTRSDVRSSVRITLLDEARNPVMAWTLRNARPVKHVSGPLRGGSSAVAVEELVICHEGLVIE